MCENKILELKSEILKGCADDLFLNTISDIILKNKILYTDNCSNLFENELEAVKWIEPFMHLLHRGSKHTVGKYCENGFRRIVRHNNVYMLFKFYTGPDTFIIVELWDEKNSKNNDIKNKIVTLELLQLRLQEGEDVKNELSPIIEKYLKAGLTFEEITNLFVDIMRENRIKI